MFVVIFKAKSGQQDTAYQRMVEELRQLAFEKYRCIEFVAVTEGEDEIALSYWHSMEDILDWKQNSTHINAQNQGKKKWYQSYKVQIAEVKHEYSFGSQ